VRQTTVLLAFASVSNVVITVLLPAGSGLAVDNFKAAKNFGLSTSFESRTALAACRRSPDVARLRHRVRLDVVHESKFVVAEERLRR